MEPSSAADAGAGGGGGVGSGDGGGAGAGVATGAGTEVTAGRACRRGAPPLRCALLRREGRCGGWLGTFSSEASARRGPPPDATRPTSRLRPARVARVGKLSLTRGSPTSAGRGAGAGRARKLGATRNARSKLPIPRSAIDARDHRIRSFTQPQASGRRLSPPKRSAGRSRHPPNGLYFFVVS